MRSLGEKKIETLKNVIQIAGRNREEQGNANCCILQKVPIYFNAFMLSSTLVGSFISSWEKKKSNSSRFERTEKIIFHVVMLWCCSKWERKRKRKPTNNPKLDKLIHPGREYAARHLWGSCYYLLNLLWKGSLLKDWGMNKLFSVKRWKKSPQYHETPEVLVKCGVGFFFK